MAQLTAIEGALRGRSFPLSGEVTIGRLPECTITIDDASVSRRHVVVRPAGEGFSIEDLGSAHGTLVNGQGIASPVPLHDGAVIQICSHVFRVELEPAAAGEGEAALEAAEESDVEILEDEEAEGATIEGMVDLGATMVGGTFMPSAAGDKARANERLQSIIRISNAIQTELELNVLLGLVMDSLFEVFRLADRAFLMLYDENGEFKPAASRNRQGEPERITISRSIIREVTNRRIAVLSSDAMTDERFTGAMSILSFGIRSMMCAPLVAKDELLGIIHLDTAGEQGRFSQDDLELLSGVASQTALAIASARMHERLLHRDRMERDLKIATQVQTSFLPLSRPQVEGMEFAAFYRAALEVGGDMYDFIAQLDESLMVAVGDVSGKGVPAALLMARVSSDARFFSIQEREPKDVLPHLSQRIEETGMTDVFVTMALIRADLASHRILTANAGHCPPLVRRAAEGDVIEIGGRPGLPLGVMADFDYEQSEYALKPGDV
ncbi:MAG: SpoIIE family protein phosphatase, partial [Planctomycetota bacterium]